MGDVTDLVDWEVQWYRSIFRTRFFNGELPKVGDPMSGWRCKVYVQLQDGTFVPWSQRHTD